MKTQDRPRRKMTAVIILHYIKLTYRSLIFLTALAMYIAGRIRHSDYMIRLLETRPFILTVIWVVFAFEMVLRFFPSQLESPGCQKQFAHNYIKTGSTSIEIEDNNATVLVALIWVFFNAIFGVLYMSDILDDGIMILLCLAFSVCDIICILFYCPFQSIFLKNKCCSTCRIYNWDYAMMFTPLFFIRSIYSWSLLLLSVGLLARWEITIYKHPERFALSTNAYLECKNCSEKLCAHKKQLTSLRKRIAAYTAKRLKSLMK